MKKLISLVLAFMMLFSFTTFACADTDNSSDEARKPSTPTRIWTSNTYIVNDNSALYPLRFTIPDPYCAFEVTATTPSGGTVSGFYTVSLLYQSVGHLADINVPADGQTYKVDWVSVVYPGSSDYGFRLYNHSGTTLSITVTFYSW